MDTRIKVTTSQPYGATGDLVTSFALDHKAGIDEFTADFILNRSFVGGGA